MMKTKVLKGFAALLALLIVCFFFSGTIRTLTTAKVMLVTPRQRRLTENISLTGMLHFSETEDITLALPDGTALTVTKVHVVPGMAVKSGDVLFETSFPGAAGLIAAQEQQYAFAQTALLALEREHSSLRLQRTDENLLRINDKIAELELQVAPLKSQSEKAKKFLILRDEMKGLEISLWMETLEHLRANSIKLETDYREAERQMKEASKMLEFEYAAVLRDQIRDLRKQLEEQKTKKK